jgi:RNA polymerase sigma-70 factor (ECF subfamily)
MTATIDTRNEGFACWDDPLDGGLERSPARHAEAMRRVLDDYLDPIYARVRSSVRSEHTAEDLMQDILLIIQRSLPTFDRKRRLAPWVYAIATNRLRDHWRSCQRPRALDLQEDAIASSLTASEPAESELERRERQEAIREALGELPRDLGAVLMLRVYDGLPFPVIARMLGLSTAGVQKRHAKALRLLRERLDVASVTC